MFKKLCGDQFYPRVFLITTMWDQVSSMEGEQREQELISKSNFWGTMIKGGASSKRHYGTRDSAMDILRDVTRNRKVDAPKVLKVQHEMVDDKLRLDQTDAGRQFEVELLKQRERHEHEMRQMQEDVKILLDMNEERAAAETERQRRLFEVSFHAYDRIRGALRSFSGYGASRKNSWLMHDGVGTNRSKF